MTDVLTAAKAVSVAIGEQKEPLRRGIELKMTFHETTFQGILQSLKMSLNAEKFVWIETIEKRLVIDSTTGLDDDDDDADDNELGKENDVNNNFSMKPEEFLDRVEKTIETLVKPAIRDMIQFLDEEYRGHTRPEVAVGSLPGGIDYYAQCLEFHIDLPMTPREVHELGLKEVDRIETEIAVNT